MDAIFYGVQDFALLKRYLFHTIEKAWMAWINKFCSTLFHKLVVKSSTINRYS